ncbi:quinone-dependent dihydroorotate dehydrogenase [Sulfurospirillum sp. 1612]|uniref:quinone-dependent dihydroorotate dehydrogenase n=1 Tax=Sulfurospirillum sp. 1612 TaxID=3094835 RepID=UPI002F95A65C
MFKYETLKKIFFLLSPEHAHDIAACVMRFFSNYCHVVTSFLAQRYFITNKELEQEIWGVTFLNPIGLAAGFDKNATMIRMLTALGFGHIEFGTITPVAQSGNKKPRMFRYPEAESIQNAMGFNNEGMIKVANRIKRLYPFATPLGANIGKNKITPAESALNDYKLLIDEFKDICDYLVINISSPNTPGLRDLQNEQFIRDLFVMAREMTQKPILLKIAPDLEIADALSICKIAVDNGASGIIATNTTIDYTLLENSQNFGGISGRVLKEKSFELFDAIAQEFYSKTILISVGGIDSAQEAYRRIKAGASLVQIYSSFIFKGPGIMREINEGILELMHQDGFHQIKEAIGSNR